MAVGRRSCWRGIVSFVNACVHMIRASTCCLASICVLLLIAAARLSSCNGTCRTSSVNEDSACFSEGVLLPQTLHAAGAGTPPFEMLLLSLNLNELKAHASAVSSPDATAQLMTNRKAAIRVADPQLEAVARFIVSMLPDTFAKARQGYHMPLATFARGGNERCDVYVGKGILLAGPVVVADVGLALAAPVPSDEWTRPYLMFGRQNGITAGGAASAVAASSVTSEQFREMLSRLLKIKRRPSSAEFISLNARVMAVRADLDVSDVAAFDEVMQARIAEYDRDIGFITR
eukprot:XP_001692308.1 predicted protein [Chlamydomonas reinhardtii]